MDYLNKAAQLEDQFNELFPIQVNHSGGSHSCETFAELEEWDSAAGELWFDWLDSTFDGWTDFSLEDLEKRGDDLILEMYVKSTLESFINGNIESAIDEFNTMFGECDFNDVIDFLNAEESPKNTQMIILKLLEGKY